MKLMALSVIKNATRPHTETLFNLTVMAGKENKEKIVVSLEHYLSHRKRRQQS